MALPLNCRLHEMLNHTTYHWTTATAPKVILDLPLSQKNRFNLYFFSGGILCWVPSQESLCLLKLSISVNDFIVPKSCLLCQRKCPEVCHWLLCCRRHLSRHLWDCCYRKYADYYTNKNTSWLCHFVTKLKEMWKPNSLHVAFPWPLAPPVGQWALLEGALGRNKNL